MNGDKKDERPPPWKSLLYDFTQETTMHGVRLVTGPTPYILRRVMWTILLLGSITLFSYLAHGRIEYLRSNPKAVNVEVTYTDNLRFPAITICNENLYRLTAIFEEGLYDLFVNDLGNFKEVKDYTTEQSSCPDNYTFIEDICDIPPEHFLIDQDAVLVNDTTRKTCKYLCSGIFNATCSGVLYDREKLSCLISAYTGYYHISTDVSCRDSPMEFFARERCIVLETFRCDFETDGCPLYDNTTKEDQWKVVTASSYQINRDNTLNFGSGRYLYLLETERRPGYTARVVTDYLDTTGKCLSLMYWRLGTDPASLRIYVRNEEQQEFIMYVMSDDRIVEEWRSMIVYLPSGKYRVIVEGKRGARGNSGFAIDDVVLDHCINIAPECIQTKLGKEYRGKKSTTENGETCQRWDSEDLLPFLGEKVLNLPDNSVTEADNYCRNLPELGWSEPKCYDNAGVALPCGLPYCACGVGKYQCLSDGYCLPEEFTCDGRPNCGDGSDETVPCVEKLKIACDFEEAYQCGFQQMELVKGLPMWKRHKGAGLAKNTSPKADSHGSLMGWYMTTDSRATGEGDNLILISPVRRIQQNVMLTFSVHMKLNRLDSVASLTLMSTTANKRPVRVIYQISTSGDSWQEHSACLPVGEYALMLAATAGRVYESDIAIDSMTMGGDCFPLPDRIILDNGTANCDFDGDSNEIFCNWGRYGSNDFSQWEQTAANKVIKTVLGNSDDTGSTSCDKDYTDLTGTITSPNYPEVYPSHSNCKYRILQPVNSTILLTFSDMDIEHGGNYCPYDSVQIEFKTGDPEKLDGATTTNTTSKMCGQVQPLPTFSHDGNIVIVTFRSDSVVNERGFSLTYTSTLVASKDFAAVASFRGTSSFFEHYAWLISPPIPSTPHCLRAQIYVGIGLEISYEFSRSGKGYKDVVFQTTSTLGNSYHEIVMGFGDEIAREADNQTGRLVITSQVPRTPDEIAAAITYIKVDDGNCLDTSARKISNFTERQFRCEFDRLDNCGFIDVSPSIYKWARRQSDTYGLHMGVNLGPKVSVSSLISPEIRLANTTCLSAHYRIDSEVVTEILYSNSIRIFTISIDLVPLDGSPEVTISTVNEHRPYLWNAIYAEIPTGEYRVRINVITSDEIDLTPRYYINMDSIVTAVGNCDASTTVGVECSFETVYVCGYTVQRPLERSTEIIWYREQDTSYPYNYVWPNRATFNSSDGWFMTFGDLVNGQIPPAPSILFSPLHEFLIPTTIKLWYSIYQGEIQIYQYKQHVFQRHLDTLRGSDEYDERFSWREYSLCVPAGSYQLAFMGRVDATQYAAIDDITVDHDTPCIYSEPADVSVACDFINETICGYITMTKGNEFAWNRDLRDMIEITESDGDLEADVVLQTSKGIITSPGFPEPYQSYASHLTHIYLAPNTTVTFTFKSIDIEDAHLCIYDYAQIGVLNENGYFGYNAKKYCGSNIPSPLVLEGERFGVRFISDSYLNQGGFELTYTSDSIAGAETNTLPQAMFARKAAMTNGETEYSASLFSSLANYDGPACITLPIVINASLTVSLQADGQAPKAVISRSESTVLTDVRFWNYIRMPIALNNASQYQLALVVSTRKQGIFTGAILNEVSVESGACVSHSVEEIGFCDFSNETQCGYLDESFKSGNKWLRVQQRFNGVNGINGSVNGEIPVVMQTELYNYQETNTLKSPVYNVTSPQCLSFNFVIDTSNIRIIVTAKANDTNLANEIFGADEALNKWLIGLVDLPVGLYRIEFQASLIGVEFDLPVTASISNINYTEGACVRPIQYTTTPLPLGVVTTRPFTSSDSGLKAYEKVLETHGNRSMRSLTELMGHQQQDIIHTCLWQGNECKEFYLTPEYTDKGYCMSFNKEDIRALDTNRTGAEFGVRVTLNIEQYQHLRGYSVDAGIKVHLHGHEDISSVRDLGFAVAPGAHALAGVTFTTSKSLPEPYGQCLEHDDREIPSYPGQNYTQLKCQQHCRTVSLVEHCQCRDISMPGDAPICNLNQYLRCQMQWDEVNGTEAKANCDCPDSCRVNNYLTELSSSQLSGLSVESLLSENGDVIQENFIHALEVKNRVEEDLLSATINGLQSTIVAYETFVDAVQFNIIQTATSITDRIQQAVYKMQALSLQETTTVLNESRTLNDKYLTYRDASIQLVISHIDKVAEEVALVRDIVQVTNPDRYFEGSWIYSAVESASRSVEDLNKILKLEELFEIPGLYKVYLPPNIFGSDGESKICEEARAHLRNTDDNHGLPELKTKLDDYAQVLANNGYNTNELWTGWEGYSSSSSGGYSSGSGGGYSSGSGGGYPSSSSGGYSSGSGGGYSSGSGGGYPSSSSGGYSSGSGGGYPSSSSGGYSSGSGGGYPSSSSGGGYSSSSYGGGGYYSGYSGFNSFGQGGGSSVTATPRPPPDWLQQTTTPAASGTTDTATTPPVPTSGFSTDIVLSDLALTMSYLIKYRNCTVQYRTFLDEVNTWLDNMEAADYILSYDFEQMLRQFKLDIQWLKEIKDQYISNEKSKLSIARLITSDLMSTLASNIEKEFSNINSNILQPLADITGSASTEVVTSYIQMLEYVARFKEFFREMDRFEVLAKDTAILRSPVPNIETPQIITFTLDESEVYTVWPSSQPTSSFLSGTGEDILRNIVGDYFDVLSTELTTLYLQFVDLRRDFDDNMTTLQESMQAFITSSEVGEEFVMENFLKLDIYFGELKYEEIEQQPAYGILQFFSEIGGYMGLLLGGSIITILEFMDLILYNTMIKLVNARGHRRVSPATDTKGSRNEAGIRTVSKNTDTIGIGHRPPSYSTIDGETGTTDYNTFYK